MECRRSAADTPHYPALRIIRPAYEDAVTRRIVARPVDLQSIVSPFVFANELNVWPAPSARGEFHLALISLLQRIRSRASNPAKMEIRAA